MPISIWWIRRDLRLTDNQALHAALANTEAHAARVLPLFIIDPTLLNSAWVGEKRTAFLFAGLRALDAQLREIGSHLIVRRGSPADVLKALVQEATIIAIHAERDYSPYAVRRDQAIAQEFPLHLHNGVTIRPTDSIRKDDGTPYTVFTPYSRRWRKQAPIQRSDILPAPKIIPTADTIKSESLPEVPAVANTLPFPAGETEAKQRLGNFVKGDPAPICDYAKFRDQPALNGTAQLSPYLRFGMLSPRLAALGGYSAMTNVPTTNAHDGAHTWLSELIWRDFYITILAEFPHVRQGAFRPEYDSIQWANNEQEFVAWCAGQTGYPFVDAAMRQLQTIGWMHNRARMVVASFLVKDLLIDWRWGERWFMQHLVDGDPAANNGGWQWSAGTGTDAAPYFRVFNPISQGEKFDPDGEYVRRWVPELKNVPTKHIHAPWKLPRSEQIRARCVIGEEYPQRLVDHKWARQRTLAAYKAVPRK